MKAERTSEKKPPKKADTKEFERPAENGGDTIVFDAKAKKKKKQKKQKYDSAAMNGETVPIRAVNVKDDLPAEVKEKEPVTLQGILHKLGSVWKADTEITPNAHYVASAQKVRYLKYAVIAILILFVLGVITFRHQDLTSENLRYFLRDFDFGSTKYTGEYATVRFDRQSGTEFAAYKGDLVLVRPGETSIYSSGGTQLLSDSTHFVSPRVLSSDKYFLVYDPGDSSRTFALYNAFSRLYTEECTSQIIDASLSKNGVYCIVNVGETYKAVIRVYNADFKLLNTIYKDKYVWDAVLSEDGARLMILSSYSENGSWKSEIEVLDPYNEQPLFHSTLDNVTVLSGIFCEDCQSFRILTDKGLLYFKNSSAQGKEIDFDGRIPVSFSLSSSISAVAFNRNVLGNELDLLVSDEEGGKLGSFVIPAGINRSACIGGRIYVLTDQNLYILDPTGEDVKTVPLADPAEAVIPLDDDNLFLCFGNRAEVIKTDGTFPKRNDAK